METCHVSQRTQTHEQFQHETDQGNSHAYFLTSERLKPGMTHNQSLAKMTELGYISRGILGFKRQ